MVMRPYQIAASERIIQKIKIADNYKQYGTVQGGGYVWHTTGSGKTLTSFKTSQIASKLPYIDKVLFIVDRKDLDYQTMKEYERFEKGCANGNNSTAVLQRQLEDTDEKGGHKEYKVIVSTIQKLDKFVSNDIDVILPTPLYVGPSLAENYRNRHIASDYDYMLQVIKEIHPDDYEPAKVFWEETAIYSPCNMFIMKRNILNEFCEWLFPILFAVVKHIGAHEDAYQNRYPGFMSERLLSYYFEHNKDKYKKQKKLFSKEELLEGPLIIKEIAKGETKMARVFNVEGMMCPHCEANVKQAVEAMAAGVEAVADHNAGTVTVTGADDVSADDIKAIIEGKGYKFLGEN